MRFSTILLLPLLQLTFGCASTSELRALETQNRVLKAEVGRLQDRVVATERSLHDRDDTIAMLRSSMEQVRQGEASLRESLIKEKQALEQRHSAAVSKLATVESVSKAELLAKLQDVPALMDEKQTSAYYRGMTDLWQSLEVRGQPSDDGGWIMVNHYYTFEVRLLNKTFFSHRIRTASEEGPVGKAFSALVNTASLVASVAARP